MLVAPRPGQVVCCSGIQWGRPGVCCAGIAASLRAGVLCLEGASAGRAAGWRFSCTGGRWWLYERVTVSELLPMTSVEV